MPLSEEIDELIRDYRDGKITRRGFMRRVVILTGSVAGANSMIAGLMQGSAEARDWLAVAALAQTQSERQRSASVSNRFGLSGRLE